MTDKPLVKRRPNELRDLIEGPDFRAQLLKALPNAMSPERFVRITATSMMRNPKLMQCNRDTFFRCLLDLSAMGLEPDGRQAHLIPRKNKTGSIDCTLIVDYKGLKELMYRNGDIIDEHSDVVGDLDLFEYEFGSNKHLRHVPNTRDRGKIYCAYSFITLPKGGTTFDVMSTEEIETIRKRSSYPDGDPWTLSWGEMAKKTVFKRLSKSVPLSPKSRDALEVDNTYEMERQEPPAPLTKTAIVGGRRELPPEPEDNGEPEPPTDPFDSGPTQPDAAPVSPPQPVSAAPASNKPPGPLTQVRARLNDAGFKPEELLALLQHPSVRMVTKEVTDISLVPANKLLHILGDWENCVKRLGIERANAQNPPPPPAPDDFPA